MTTNNRFNKYTKTREWFCYTKFLFRTSNHPIIKSKEPCRFQIKAVVSQQEEEMLKGLASTLQCEGREAVRIALYELSTSDHKQSLDYVENARAGSKLRAHTGRSRKLSARLSKTDRDIATELEGIYGLTSAEVIRLAIIYLEKGIRNDSITILAGNSRRVSNDKIAEEWGKLNKDKPASESTKAAKQTRDFWREYNTREVKAQSYKYSRFDQEVAEEAFNSLIAQAKLEVEDMDADEKSIYFLMAKYTIPYEEAKWRHEIIQEELIEISAMTQSEFMDYMREQWKSEDIAQAELNEEKRKLIERKKLHEEKIEEDLKAYEEKRKGMPELERLKGEREWQAMTCGDHTCEDLDKRIAELEEDTLQ